MLECCPRFCFWSLLDRADLWMLERSCRHFFVLLDLKGIPPDVSCDNAAEDELALELEEPDDNPGTTIP